SAAARPPAPAPHRARRPMDPIRASVLARRNDGRSSASAPSLSVSLLLSLRGEPAGAHPGSPTFPPPGTPSPHLPVQSLAGDGLGSGLRASSRGGGSSS